MTKKSILNSPRIVELKKKRQRAILKKVFIFLTAILVVLAGGIFLTRFERVNIKQVEVIGNKIIDTRSIEEVVQSEIEGHYLWLLPRTNFLLYPKKEIISKLSNNFKRLQNITLTINDTNTLQVMVSERVAVYTWCGELVRDMDSEECYFLDETGYVLDRAPYFSGDVYFRFYGPIEALDNNPTGSYYTKDNFAKLASFKKVADTMKLRPVALSTDQNGQVKMYLAPDKNGHNPEILMETKQDFEKLAENLLTALDTEPLKTKFKTKYSSLLYIDLRFGNKVYFKFSDSASLVAE